MLNNCKEIRVPIEIIKIKNLTITQKVLLSQIASLDNEEGCFATNSYFAELFNLSKTQISNIISDLKEKVEEYYGIKRNEPITNSSTNEYENGRTSKETNIFRGTNSKTREYKKINGCNNEQYKQLYKGIKLENVQNRNNGIRYKKSNSGNSKFTSKVENTSKIKICGVRNDNKCNNINFINTSNKIIYTSNSLTNLIIELFKSNNNGMYREDNKNHSSFDFNAKLQYALNKHYSLEELDDELEI